MRLIERIAAVSCVFIAVTLRCVQCGSCKEAKLCCPGRDSSCVVQKAPINAIIEDLNDKPCYCDHACLKLGDCCDDFKQACGVVDCQVTPWGPWSACDSDCGPGMMSRSRSIKMQPQNGGRHCPSLQQRRGCHVSDCHHHQDAAIRVECSRDLYSFISGAWVSMAWAVVPGIKRGESPFEENLEIAMLLPGSLSHIRRANDTSDIRRNLRLKDPEEHPEHDPEREYCVEFEILKASKACRKEQNFKALKEGERICVKCESEALRKNLGWRCQGHGVEGRTTRWSALSAPHCHGKWLRAQAEQDHECLAKTCQGDNAFIFV